jgi:cyclic pyranopterin phosphate synthase
MELRNFDFSKKIFFHPERVFELQKTGRTFPVTVEIDLTNACNHRCSFCFYAEHIAVDRSTLETNRLIGVLSELKESGAKGVSFTGGGEPTLHKDFKIIVRHAYDIGLDVGLITNGSALTSSNIDSVLETHTWVRISMAGGEPIGYRAVQGVDHFDRVIRNIDTLMHRRREAMSSLSVGIRMLVTQKNLDGVVNLARISRELGIDYLQLAPDQFTKDEGSFWKADETQAVFRETEIILSKSHTRLLTSAYVWHQSNLNYPSKCYAHHFQIAILAEGHVAFCKNARGAENFYLGNIYKNSIAEIWDSKINRDLEERIKPSNCGLYCKHTQINNSLEDILNPPLEMTRNFVG